MRRVVLESPFAADTPEGIEANIEYARRCVRDSLMRGESPIASHLLYTQPGILRDDVPGERSAGIAAGHAWLGVADATVVYMDRGISRGMKQGIDAVLIELYEKYAALAEARIKGDAGMFADVK